MHAQLVSCASPRRLNRRGAPPTPAGLAPSLQNSTATERSSHCGISTELISVMGQNRQGSDDRFWSDHFRLFGKNRRWAGRDCVPPTQRRCLMDDDGGRIRRCRGIGQGAGQLVSVSVTSDHRDVGITEALWGRGLDGLVVYPGRRLDFAGSAYPALTRAIKR